MNQNESRNMGISGENIVAINSLNNNDADAPMLAAPIGLLNNTLTSNILINTDLNPVSEKSSKDAAGQFNSFQSNNTKPIEDPIYLEQ